MDNITTGTRLSPHRNTILETVDSSDIRTQQVLESNGPYSLALSISAKPFLCRMIPQQMSPHSSVVTTS